MDRVQEEGKSRRGNQRDRVQGSVAHKSDGCDMNRVQAEVKKSRGDNQRDRVRCQTK